MQKDLVLAGMIPVLATDIPTYEAWQSQHSPLRPKPKHPKSIEVPPYPVHRDGQRFWANSFLSFDDSVAMSIIPVIQDHRAERKRKGRNLKARGGERESMDNEKVENGSLPRGETESPKPTVTMTIWVDVRSGTTYTRDPSLSSTTPGGQSPPQIPAILRTSSASLSTTTSSLTTPDQGNNAPPLLATAPPTLLTGLTVVASTPSLAPAGTNLARTSSNPPSLSSSMPAYAPIPAASENARPGSGNAQEEVTKPSAAAGASTASGPTITTGVEAVIISVSVVLAFGALIFLIWHFVYKKSKNRKIAADLASHGAPSVENPPVGGEPQMSSFPSATGPSFPAYLPPRMPERTAQNDNPFVDPSNPFADPTRKSTLTNNAIEREERLGYVRPELLAPREMHGGLMRSATRQQGIDMQPNGNHIRSASGNEGSGYGDADSYSNASANVNANLPASRAYPNAQLPVIPDERWNEPLDTRFAQATYAAEPETQARYQTQSQWVNDQTYRGQENRF
ncbi:hypothetical protein LZ554_002690 [Drepanopeziza brunnea f. sp. 'monogermtubi']|nr:hypothetical protein LZ554_002690 [Drepanopeziza brunnea f. sp. 'monogermtubi']